MNKPSIWPFPYYSAEQASSFDWEAICKTYPWISLLEDCPQDPIHHAEGNVQIHTRMVLENLIKLDDFKALSADDRQVLFLSTLMHDIGKPACTEKNGERYTAYGHARKGAQMTRNLFYRDGAIDFKRRERIVSYVRNHGIPLWFWDKPDPLKTILRLSESISLHQLSLIAEADVKGRIANDLEEMHERVLLFRELAKEHNCLHNSWPFPNGLSRFEYFSKDGNPPSYNPYDISEFGVILMSGLPGAGKNTYIEKNYPDLPVVSMDAIRKERGISPKDNQGQVIQAAKELAKTYLRKKQPFIWNATNIVRQRRKGLVDLFTTYKAKVRIVYLEVPYKTLMSRNASREAKLPTKVLERFVNNFEVPEIQEAPIVDYIVKD